MIEPYQIEFTREDNHRLRGLTREKSLEILLGDRDFPLDVRAEMLSVKNEYYLQSIQQLSQKDLLPGVLDLLVELDAAGIKTGVASASRHVTRILDLLQIRQYIRATCDGSQVRRSKPDPEPYLQVARILGVSPAACLVIEDSEAGVESGVCAGMCVVGLGEPARLSAAFEVVEDLASTNLDKLRAIHKRWLGEGFQPLT